MISNIVRFWVNPIDIKDNIEDDSEDDSEDCGAPRTLALPLVFSLHFH